MSYGVLVTWRPTERLVEGGWEADRAAAERDLSPDLRSAILRPASAAERGIVAVEVLLLHVTAHLENSAGADRHLRKSFGHALEKSVAIGNGQWLGSAKN